MNRESHVEEDFPRTDFRAEMQEYCNAYAKANAANYARERWPGNVIEASIRYAGTLRRGSCIHPDKLEGGPDLDGRYWRWFPVERTLPNGTEIEPLIFQAKFRLHPLPNAEHLCPPVLDPFSEHFDRRQIAYRHALTLSRENGSVIWTE